MHKVSTLPPHLELEIGGAVLQGEPGRVKLLTRILGPAQWPWDAPWLPLSG